MPDLKKPATAPVVSGNKRDSWTNEANHEYGMLTVQDLNTILEVNQKALSIYLEVEQQNAIILTSITNSHEKLKIIEEFNDNFNQFQKDILKSHSDHQESLDAMKKNIEELDKNFFRLMIILGSAGIGTIITIIQSFIKK